MCENPTAAVVAPATDKERLEALLIEWKVLFENDNPNGTHQIIIGHPDDVNYADYDGFTIFFDFDAEEKFLSAAAWCCEKTSEWEKQGHA